MGYYFQAPTHEKADALLALGAKELDQKDAEIVAKYGQDKHGIFCVVDNGLFDAAAFCFSAHEFASFTHPSDTRPKRFFSLPREQACELVGYKESN